MPAWVLGILGSLGQVALGMLSSLVTDAFIKQAIVAALERLVAGSGSDLEQKLLDAAKSAWKVS